MGNIREDKGYTYGIYSYLMNHIHDGGWMISTKAGRDVSVATVNEVYAEMKELREELIDEEELRMTACTPWASFTISREPKKPP